MCVGINGHVTTNTTCHVWEFMSFEADCVNIHNGELEALSYGAPVGEPNATLRTDGSCKSITELYS